MNLQEYSNGALQTESRIDAARVFDYEQFKNIIDVIINANRLLDMYKKNIYYGKPINQEAWRSAVGEIIISGKVIEDRTFRAHDRVPRPETLGIDPRILHGIIGISTEASELLEAIQPHLLNQDREGTIDGVNLGEEVGDISWYIAVLLDSISKDWEQELIKNAAKLQARNKGKTFNAEATINRDVEAERAILEGNSK